MNRPEIWSIDRLSAEDLGAACIWSISSCINKVKGSFHYDIITEAEVPASNVDTLIVVGGGSLIDRAKIWREEHNPNVKLVAIPSIWGSGAENSPIAVLNTSGGKKISIGEELLPDARVVWSDLACTIPEEKMRDACGDVWAHALEGFLSPLAKEALREELAELINLLAEMPISKDVRWFELSARACACQANSSVGLIHGIAHTLEGRTHVECGHARLCSVYLLPVLRLNMQNNPKIYDLFDRYSINAQTTMKKAQELFNERVYDDLLPSLKDSWGAILKDGSTRTNCTLVRASHLDHFLEKKWL